MILIKKLGRYPDLALAFLFAAATSFFAPPNARDVIGLINIPLLGLLFFLMCIVAGLRLSGFFDYIFKSVFHGQREGRTLSRFFIFACFFSSMLITNDVALIVFVPLSILAFTETHRIRFIVPTVTWQTIAANMGSMLTPIGNPQNLFIYSHYKLDMGEFLSVTSPIVVLSGVLIYIATFSLPRHKVDMPPTKKDPLPRRRVFVLFLLFLICLAHVVHLLSFNFLAVIMLPSLFLLDKKLFLQADCKLLLLFALLFIGVGNLGRISFFKDLPALMSGHEFWLSLLLSQIMSNVPTTVLLAEFTRNYAPLLLGVNIGGLGTIIASMASVISFKAYADTRFHKSMYYLLSFTISNLAVLAILLAYYLIFMDPN